MSFRASAARYRLDLAFTDPPAASPTRSKAGVWLLASSRRCLVRARNRTQSNRLSWTFPLPQSSHPRSLPSSCAVPKIRAVQQDSPHEVFAPSAHQARRIHQRGVPHPLCSAFAVAPALTVSSPPDPAGLFRPAALLGFQDRTRHVHDSLGSPGPSGDDPHQLRPLRRPLARPRPCVAVSPGLASLAVA